MALTITTMSAAETHNLGEVLGRSISSSLIITLTGDLGSGKTVLVQGLAKGLEVPGEYYVTSPSYTLINAYPGRLTLYHADLYRLTNRTDLEDLELPDLLNGEGVVAIEWADRIDARVLGEHLALQIETTGATSRSIRLSSDACKIQTSDAGQGRSDLLREVEKKLR